MQPVPTFHVLNGDIIEGPYTPGQLRVLEERGTINGETQIARHGEAEWLPLEVWREVIHGAPTHRGPIPGGMVKRGTGTREAAGAGPLVKLALVLALAGIVVMLGGESIAGSKAWLAGGGTLGVAMLLWVVGARK